MEIPIRPVASDDGDDQDRPAYDMSPITPLPSGSLLPPVGGGRVLVDTWVELVFVDQEGVIVATVRRTLTRTSRGGIQGTVTGLSDLNVDPISLDVGTRMPALIPYIQLEQHSDIGEAVAALTGLRPLKDLVIHATKSRDKLRKEMVDDRQQQMATLDRTFLEARQQLQELLDQYRMALI